MTYLPLTLADPAENLALDEALLELAEAEGVEALRVWESPIPFVVLGLSNHASREVREDACTARGIPILRRASGGGTVVQGPGCLSYALTLRLDGSAPLASITATNRYIMERNRSALEALLAQPVGVRGHTDLETAGRKFSGNASRRARNALLFHGTILYGADLDLIGDVLAHPSREPDWRLRRSHGQFITNLPVSVEQLTNTLREAWKAEQTLAPARVSSQLASLVGRHRDPAWVFRLP